MSKIKIICLIGLIIIFFLLLWFDYKFQIGLLSDLILCITALIIFWYTFETYQIRKSNQKIEQFYLENLEKSHRPVVAHELFTNNKKPFDIRLKLINLSEHTIAVQVKCNFEFDGNLIKDIWPEYDGKKFWNLQYKEILEGHFSMLDLFLKSKLITNEKYEDIKHDSPDTGFTKIKTHLHLSYNMEKPPNLIMNLELFCRNELNKSTYYLPKHYEYDYFKSVWIPDLTSLKPYWEYKIKPSWI